MIRSMSGCSSAGSVISVLRMRPCHVNHRICLWNFMWKDSRPLVSEASRVPVPDGYERTEKANVWYICNIIDNDERLSHQVLWWGGMIEDARPRCCLTSGWQYPSDDWMEPRYTKLCTGSKCQAVIRKYRYLTSSSSSSSMSLNKAVHNPNMFESIS